MHWSDGSPNASGCFWIRVSSVVLLAFAGSLSFRRTCRHGERPAALIANVRVVGRSGSADRLREPARRQGRELTPQLAALDQSDFERLSATEAALVRAY